MRYILIGLPGSAPGGSPSVQGRLEGKEINIYWPTLTQDLSQAQAVNMELDGKHYLLRTDLKSSTHKAFLVAVVRPPPPFTPLD